MKRVSHKTAKASHYNKESESYDAFNEAHSALINATLEKILKKYDVTSVLDLTCGTGSQVFWLARCGFTVVGSDINGKMLKIAKEKARHEAIDITFIKGDMRTTQIGKFDAVITIFNSIGHLTKIDFEIALRNIARNLKKGGLYIFDIANLTYFLTGNHIAELTVDWSTTTSDTRFRDIQYGSIDTDGILALYNISFIQKKDMRGVAQRAKKSVKTLQIYTAKQLKELLDKAGFKVLEQCDIDGSPFVEERTDRILTIAQKL